MKKIDIDKLQLGHLNISGRETPYWRFQDDDFIVIIEPCDKGYDIRQYSSESEFPVKEACSNIQIDGDIRNKALAGKLILSIADNYYKDYQLKKSIKEKIYENT